MAIPPVCTKCLFPKGESLFTTSGHLQFPRAKSSKMLNVLHVEQLQVPIFQRKRSIYDTCIFALKTHTWNMKVMISKFGIIFSKRGLPCVNQKQGHHFHHTTCLSRKNPHPHPLGVRKAFAEIFSKKIHQQLQGVPLPVINGVITPISRVITPVPFIRPFIRVIPPFITSRGPPCNISNGTV